MSYLRCKAIAEVFDVKDVRGGFALIPPNFAVCIKDAFAKQIPHSIIQKRSFDIVFKVVYSIERVSSHSGLASTLTS